MKKIVLIALVVGLIVGCKKKKTEEETTSIAPAIPAPSAPIFIISVPADTDGVIMASQAPYEFSNSYVTQLGTASAFFYTAPGNYNYVDAGIVKCNDSTLVKQSSGSYYYGGKAINGQPFSGISYTAGSNWTIAGTASVPTFTFGNTSFPTTAALTSGTLISKTSSYNVTFSGASNADSVVVVLTGDSTGLQKKTVAASAGSCNFSAAQIGAVKKMASSNFPYINLISYKIQANAVSTKKYYMVDLISSSYRFNTY